MNLEQVGNYGVKVVGHKTNNFSGEFFNWLQLPVINELLYPTQNSQSFCHPELAEGALVEHLPAL